MKIHTDRLTISDVFAAARIARVEVDVEEHKSMSRARRFDVTLSGESKRRQNYGKNPHLFAATWDQWGVFLAYLFDLDAHRSWEPSRGMHCTGSYTSAEDFADKTADRFGAPEDEMTTEGYVRMFNSYGWPEDAHGDHRFQYDGKPYEQSCTKCSAVTRWKP